MPAHAESDAQALQAAKKELGKIKAYIKAAEWDKCRTTLNNPPLGFSGPKTIKGLSDRLGKTNKAAKGLGQDLITNQRLLDTFCYNNVFVDEGRQALGLKIDYATPLMYLQSTVQALDDLIEMFEE